MIEIASEMLLSKRQSLPLDISRWIMTIRFEIRSGAPSLIFEAIGGVCGSSCLAILVGNVLSRYICRGRTLNKKGAVVYANTNSYDVLASFVLLGQHRHTRSILAVVKLDATHRSSYPHCTVRFAPVACTRTALIGDLMQ